MVLFYFWTRIRLQGNCHFSRFSSLFSPSLLQPTLHISLLIAHNPDANISCHDESNMNKHNMINWRPVYSILRIYTRNYKYIVRSCEPYLPPLGSLGALGSGRGMIPNNVGFLGLGQSSGATDSHPASSEGMHSPLYRSQGR